MKSLLFSIIIFVLINYSCERDIVDDYSKDATFLNFRAVRGDGTVSLNWFYNYLYLKEADNMCPIRPYIVAERFDIYFSDENINHFSKLITLNDSIVHGYKVNNLTNGKSYFFFVEGIKNNKIVSYTDTIMVIPALPDKINRIYDNQNYPMEYGSSSPDKKQLAFVNRNFSWNCGDFVCSSYGLFIMNLANHSTQFIDTFAFCPDWSPTGDYIIFGTNKHRINTGFGIPQDLAIYDINNKKIKIILKDTTYNFKPDVSPDGEWIVYISNEGNYQNYNIFKIKSDGTEKTQLTFFSTHNPDIEGYPSAKDPVWSNDGQFIYFSQGDSHHNRQNIYRMHKDGNDTELVIEGIWNDFIPSISPDNKTIAFISDRTGNYEIWIYNLENKSFKQVTESNSSVIYYDWSKLEWLSGNEIMFSGSGGSYISIYSVEID